MAFERKSKTIDLFGVRAELTERSAGDVNRLIEFSKRKQEKDYSDFVIEASVVVADALKSNYENLSALQYFKKRKLQKLFSKENLLKNLSASQLFELAAEVYKLEGVEVDAKKKVATKSRKAKKSGGMSRRA